MKKADSVAESLTYFVAVLVICLSQNKCKFGCLLFLIDLDFRYVTNKLLISNINKFCAGFKCTHTRSHTKELQVTGCLAHLNHHHPIKVSYTVWLLHYGIHQTLFFFQKIAAISQLLSNFRSLFA